MSPVRKFYAAVETSFPRVSGDEPSASLSFFGVPPFSPRERG